MSVPLLWALLCVEYCEKGALDSISSYPFSLLYNWCKTSYLTLFLISCFFLDLWLKKSSCCFMPILDIFFFFHHRTLSYVFFFFFKQLRWRCIVSSMQNLYFILVTTVEHLPLWLSAVYLIYRCWCSGRLKLASFSQDSSPFKYACHAIWIFTLPHPP